MTRVYPFGFLIWLLVASATVIGTSVAWAQEASVTMTDGRTYEGQLIAQDESVVTLLIKGIKVPLRRDQVSRIQLKKTIEQQYDWRRQKLADDDVDGRYLLAYWLFENKAYRLAKQELDALGKAFPRDLRVSRLNAIVTARGDKPTQTTKGSQDPPVAQAPASQLVATQPARQNLQQHEDKLTAEQINLIKVYEIDLNANPKVVVPPAVIDRIFSQYGDYPGVPQGRRDKARFRHAPGDEQLDLLFDLRARELYSQVQVKGDPPALREFRARIHQRYVLNYCGTVGCHGGDKKGDFGLLRDKPNSELTVYTNFFRLHTTTVGNQEMINRQRPERSLLLEYGLVRSNATSPHPEVAGWQARFQNRQDRLFQDIEDWIDSLWKPSPDYGIVHPGQRPRQVVPQP